ncbi:hypothetical protein [Bacillus halotolerans]|uniref:hypothetical protein n=1 Tax=Bacillus halotolerans TaxID=260554 RepID=UPI0015E61123|nr:hypothetical protein [Bacillus halotolerans]
MKRTKYIKTDKRIMNISSASAKYLLPSQAAAARQKRGRIHFLKASVWSRRISFIPD